MIQRGSKFLEAGNRTPSLGTIDLSGRRGTFAIGNHWNALQPGFKKYKRKRFKTRELDQRAGTGQHIKLGLLLDKSQIARPLCPWDGNFALSHKNELEALGMKSVVASSEIHKLGQILLQGTAAAIDNIPSIGLGVLTATLGIAAGCSI